MLHTSSEGPGREGEDTADGGGYSWGAAAEGGEAVDNGAEPTTGNPLTERKGSLA